MINGRVVVAAALLGALLVRGPVLAWRRWLFLPVVLAGIFYGWDLARTVIRFNRHVRGFDELVETIPFHRRVLTLVFPPLNDPHVNVNCFNQWASYVQIRRGGYNFYNFDEGFPLRYRQYLPAPPWSNADKFDYEQHGSAWDYFLTHNENGLKLLTGPPAKGQVRLVGERGPWRLWQNLERR